MGITIIETVRAFNRAMAKYPEYSSATYTNLLGLSDAPQPYSFLSQFGRTLGIDIDCKDIQEAISYAIRMSIKSYSKSKETAIRIYKKYIEFLKKKYNVDIAVSFPPISVWITLERQMYIAKQMQNQGFNVSTLAEELLVSERTIEDDIKKLRGNDEDPIQVMGQKLIIEMERDRHGIRLPSTVHPLFLTMNLTQVISILQGLEFQSKKPGFEEYAVTTAVSIWAQLSEYARERILMLSDQLHLDKNWFQRLDFAKVRDGYDKLFYSERRCSSNDGCNNLLMCLKNNMRCHIEYLHEDNTSQFFMNVLVTRYDGGIVLCETGGEEHSLKIERILKSALVPEGLL